GPRAHGLSLRRPRDTLDFDLVAWTCGGSLRRHEGTLAIASEVGVQVAAESGRFNGASERAPADVKGAGQQRQQVAIQLVVELTTGHQFHGSALQSSPRTAAASWQSSIPTSWSLGGSQSPANSAWHWLAMCRHVWPSSTRSRRTNAARSVVIP